MSLFQLPITPPAPPVVYVIIAEVADEDRAAEEGEGASADRLARLNQIALVKPGRARERFAMISVPILRSMV